jgi:hypothetical protein
VKYNLTCFPQGIRHVFTRKNSWQYFEIGTTKNQIHPLPIFLSTPFFKTPKAKYQHALSG